VNPSATVFIIRLVVCFIVIDRHSFQFCLSLGLSLSFVHLIVIGRIVLLLYVYFEVRNSFALTFFPHMHVLVVFVNMGIFIIHFIIKMQVEGTLHE